MKNRISYKYSTDQISTSTSMFTQTLNKSTCRKIVHLVLSDQVILESLSRALDRNGYEVHSFSDTSRAVQDIEKCRESVSMLITEELMPPTNGFELARKTRAVAPNIPLVFVSDFRMSLEEFGRICPKLEGQITFMQTPVDISKLVSVTKQYVEPYSDVKPIIEHQLPYPKSVEDELTLTSGIEMYKGLQLKVDASA